MRTEGLQAQRGYKRKNNYGGRDLSTVAPNLFNRKFNVEKPNTVWVTDITYIRTQEGWLFLAVIIDLFSRQVMGGRINTDLVLNAITMACWRRSQRAKLLCIQTKDVSTPVMIGRACLKRTTWPLA
jgi:putative transposase